MCFWLEREHSIAIIDISGVDFIARHSPITDHDREI